MQLKTHQATDRRQIEKRLLCIVSIDQTDQASIDGEKDNDLEDSEVLMFESSPDGLVEAKDVPDNEWKECQD